MNRRDFNNLLKQYALSQIILGPLLQGCSQEEELFVPYNGKIAIIGAGVAGLYAANLLLSQGYCCKVYEASNRIGGRLGKDENFADFPIDLGAQWLHGKRNLLGDLIQQTNTTIQLDDSDIEFWYGQRIRQQLPKDLFSLFEQENQLPDISFQDFATQNGFDASYRYLVEAIAGDSGASGDKISAYWKIKEEENWSSGNQDYKFARTYFDLINDHIAPPVLPHLQLETPITEINYSGEEIQLTAANGERITADKVILTVPIPILKAGMIKFTPALSDIQSQAFQKIGMEAGMKVFLKFSQSFYKENLLGGQICASYADERVGKTGNDHVLLAFVMGQQARDLAARGSDTAIIQALLGELDQMYAGQASRYFQQGLVKNWAAEPYIQGAYSYSTIGIGNARKEAARSVGNKIYFAGEAMNTNGHHQTVFGAAETGKTAVEKLLKEI